MRYKKKNGPVSLNAAAGTAAAAAGRNRLMRCHSCFKSTALASAVSLVICHPQQARYNEHVRFTDPNQRVHSR